MKRHVRIGIVGTGNFAHTHARAIRRLHNAELTAVCGSDRGRVEEFSRAYGIKGYVDLEEFLKDPKMSLVDIVNRHDMHAGAAIVSMFAGKDVIVEKPMAVNLDGADSIITACGKTTRRLSVISQHRYDQAYMQARRIVESQALGKIIFACVLMRWCRGQEYYSGYRSWLGDPKTAGGGVLMMQAVHLIDIFTWILGPVVSVRADVDTKTHQINVEDTVVASLGLTQGASGVIMATTSASRNMRDRLEIHGEKGSIIIEDHSYLEYLQPASSSTANNFAKARFRLAKLLPFDLSLRRKLKCAGVGTQINDVINCVNQHLPFPSTAQEARHALQVIFAIYESSKSGREVLIK